MRVTGSPQERYVDRVATHELIICSGQGNARQGASIRRALEGGAFLTVSSALHINQSCMCVPGSGHLFINPFLSHLTEKCSPKTMAFGGSKFRLIRGICMIFL